MPWHGGSSIILWVMENGMPCAFTGQKTTVQSKMTDQLGTLHALRGHDDNFLTPCFCVAAPGDEPIFFKDER